MIAAVSESTASACSPSASRTSANSSIATTRSSSSRATSERVAARSRASASAGPRHRSSASVEARDRGGGIAVRVGLAGEDEQPFEALDVELVGLDPQQVAVRTGRQATAGRGRIALELEHLAQPPDVDAQCGRRARRGLAVPQLLDQLFRRDRVVRRAWRAGRAAGAAWPHGALPVTRRAGPRSGRGFEAPQAPPAQ